MKREQKVYLVQNYAKMDIASFRAKGTGRPHVCKVCGESIKWGTSRIGVHVFNEYAREFHPECICTLLVGLKRCLEEIPS